MALLSPLPGFFPLPRHCFSSLSCRPFLTLDLPRKHFTVSASSAANKPRVRRKPRSIADLCNDLREFVSAFGFPEGHVPSTKELLQHGRKDLAYIVRRRGYKFIRELLVGTNATDIDGPNQQGRLTVDCEGPEGNALDEDDSSSTINSADQGPISLEFSLNSSLQEKVVKFIQNGELKMVEDDRFDNLNESDAVDSKDLISSETVIEIRSNDVKEQPSEHVFSGRTVATALNGSATRTQLPKGDHLSAAELKGADFNNELDVETSKRKDEVELNHLKLLLDEKESELSRLKEQIEKEKVALYLLQTKAETEIRKAQKLISNTDAELQAAEETLSGLKEVQIQYASDGEVVEVTGSFNGWHHRIKMDRQPSSNHIIDPMGSRKSNIWTAVLWLYPGIYEIKFIVDGHWRIDTHREMVMAGTIQNNVLRVDR